MTVKKHDESKLPFHLIPPEALEGIAAALMVGAAKYGGRNWEPGTEWSRYYSALQRHMNRWWMGESIDPDTGLSHLCHAGACLLFLLSYEARNVGTDDRPYQEPKVHDKRRLFTDAPPELVGPDTALGELIRKAERLNSEGKRNAVTPKSS